MRNAASWFKKIIKVVLQGIYKMAGKDLTEDKWVVWLQFIGFALVGVSNFLVSYGTYAFFLYLHVNYHIANIMAFVISVLNAYFWNNRFVFKQEETGEQRVWWQTLLKTYLSYAFSGLFLTEILLYVEITVFGLPELLGPVINLIVTTPINFVMNKFWAFSTRRKRSQKYMENKG